MSRVLLLVLFFVWMAGPPASNSSRDLGPDLALFFSFYVGLVLLLGLWSRALARRVAADNFQRSIRRFNQVMFVARLMVPIWFTVGVWVLGWGGGLASALGVGMYRSVVGMLLGTFPAFATWMGLWWSQYPAERALKEQNLLVELDNDMPLYHPPPFKSYFLSNFRLQVLFTLLPVALIVLTRDLLIWVALATSGRPLLSDPGQTIEGVSSISAAAIVFVFAPLLLRRVLNATPMPDSPLRQKLETLCKRAGVRYRHILVWNTNNHVGNAAVMGVLPWVRYVLLSDMLLERLSDEEIEAVFAHELGHVVHRHMTWYAIFFIVLTLVADGVSSVLEPQLKFLGSANSLAIGAPIGFGAILLLFGAFSRRCERQADVYAARTMELLRVEESQSAERLQAAKQLATVGFARHLRQRAASETTVGSHGAWLFASALCRVATINNIPITPRIKSRPGFWNHLAHMADGLVEFANNWLHGSIAGRMQYLQDLSADRRTHHFDRTMFWLFFGLIFALITSAAFSAATGFH